MQQTEQPTIQSYQQAERPRSLPRSHQLTRFETKQWVRWLAQHLHDDKKGRYAAFSLNSLYSLRALRKRCEARCPDETFVFLLPAVSASGMEHYHGLVRVPERSTTDPRCWVQALISEDSKDCGIYVPLPIKNLFWSPNPSKLDSNLGDIHFNNDGDQVQLFTHERGDAYRVFRYWEKRRDGEIRHFGEGEFMPHRNRAAIRVRKGRDPLPRTERVQ